MSRLIRMSGYVIDNGTAGLDMLDRLAEHEDSRHWKVEVSSYFKEDKALDDKNCDLAELEKYFVDKRYNECGERAEPKKGEVWKHFKGKEVTIIEVAKHSEDATKRLVVYSCPNGIYARPLDMFMSKVDRTKYPSVEQEYRFELVTNKEQVNHPAHYNIPGRKECIEEMVDIWGPEKTADWCEMTAYKYEYRAGMKDDNPAAQDMSKREWYTNKANELRSEK